MFSVYHGLIVASNHYLTLPMLQKCRLLWICRQLHIKISSIRSKFRRNVEWVANSLIKTRRRVTQRLVWFQAVCKGLLNVNSMRRVKHNWYKIRLYLCFINVSAWSFLWKDHQWSWKSQRLCLGTLCPFKMNAFAGAFISNLLSFLINYWPSWVLQM